MRTWKSLLLLPLLSVLLVGCEGPDPFGPSVPTGPSAPQSTLTSDGAYTLVETPLLADTLRVTRWIGSEGGTLKLGAHSLTVPARAVSELTLFVMTQLPTGYIEVELLALGLDGLLDVGGDGFDNGKTVRLTLSYAKATNVVDPARLRILRVQSDGGVEELPTTVDLSRRVVVAKLDHFSRYCMAID